MNGTPWTPERNELVKVLWDKGLSCSQIAAELGGVTRNAVIGKVRRLKLPFREQSKPRSERKFGSNARGIMASIVHQKKTVLRSTRKNGGACLVQIALGELSSTDANEIPIGQRVTLLELAERHCRWPVGTPGEADFFFCGNDKFGDRPYCEGHCRIAYAKPSKLVAKAVLEQTKRTKLREARASVRGRAA